MADHVDVLVLTALKEELDALLLVRASVSKKWTASGGELPVYRAVLDGRAGPLQVAAARLTKMGGVATASLATRLIELVKPRCIAMCGVCAGHPDDTDLGDVVIADRLFQGDEGKIRHDGFQGDLRVDALRDDWLRVAQDMAGPGAGLELYAVPAGDDWKWWFLDRLAAGRDPLQSGALRRYIPDNRRQEYLQSLLTGHLVTLKGTQFSLTKAGKAAADEHRVLNGTLITAHPFHIHVGPIGSGNAVEASGAIWDRLAAGGMRKVLAVEMEAAAIGRVATDDRLPFAVVKGVMDHADRHKSDRFKGFAARAAAEVLCKLLREVVTPIVTAPVASSKSTLDLPGDQGPNRVRIDGDREVTQGAPWVFISYSHESVEHTARVTAFADKLCRQGVNAWIDRYVAAPPEGWPRWMGKQIVHADAVLIVCTETYRRRYEGDDELDLAAPGKGVGWEGFIASALLYGDRSRNHRFIPILFEGATTDDIPVDLRSTTSYRIPADLGDLMGRLAGRAPVERPQIAPSGARRAGTGKDTNVHSSPRSSIARSIQSEGVPMTIAMPSPNPVLNHRDPPAAMRSLKDFLIECFTEGEIRQLAFFHGGPDVAAQLPGAAASTDVLAWALVEALSHRALIDEAFFMELERQRERLVERIRALKLGFASDGNSPSGAAGGTHLGKARTRRAAAAPVVPGAGSAPAAEPVPAPGSAPAGKSKVRARKSAAATSEVQPASPPVSKADPGHWNAGEMEARLAKVLAQSERLCKSLEARLASGKTKGRAKKVAPPALHERVARQIVELGTGLKKAFKLVEVCFDAVLGMNADARGEGRVARELLCEWLPYGYPEVAQVVILRIDGHTDDPRNLESRTKYEHFVEIHMARLDGRTCKFTNTRVDNLEGTSFAESMFPLPPGSSQRRSTDQVVDLIVQAVGARFPRVKRVVDAQSELTVWAKMGAAPYVVVPATQRPGGFPDRAIRKLNIFFPELHIVVLTDSTSPDPTKDESMIWTMFLKLLADGV